jgi:hypothetical protein
MRTAIIARQRLADVVGHRSLLLRRRLDEHMAHLARHHGALADARLDQRPQRRVAQARDA